MEIAQSCYGREKVKRANGMVSAFTFFMSRIIRLNGREAAVLKSIGFGQGITGQELQERIRMAHDDLSDVLNTLLDIGYAETASMRERITAEDYLTETFELNPSYVADLKEALKRNY
jgi:hypothetical protein